MFIDANGVEASRIRADVVVVGSGACGLSAARHLAAGGAHVAILETGAFERTQEAEVLNRTGLSGTLSVWITSRSRLLGGSTNCWGGNNSPLDPVDFERDWLPQAQWPIRMADLEPYLDEIHDLLGLGPTDFSVDFWRKRLERIDTGLLCDGSDRVITKLIQRTQVGHLGQSLERDLDSSSKITTYLNAQVIGLSSASESKIGGVHVCSLDRSRTFSVEADAVLLAAGPENPRLLMVGDGNRSIGNEYDQLGRWWLAHNSALRGYVEPSADLDWDLYNFAARPVGDRRVFGTLQVAPEVQAEKKMLNSGCIFEPYQPLRSFNTHATLRAQVRKARGRYIEPLAPPPLSAGLVKDVARDVGSAFGEEFKRRSPFGGTNRISVRNWSEQIPHPDNRVTLSDEEDEFGTPRMTIHSSLQPEDRENLRAAFEVLGDEFEKFGHGYWVSEFPDGDEWPAGAVNTAHFMGGTRMSERPEDGVVDSDGRVHGMDNLWVAGGSVFPTAGVSMVTYTAIALALRTADAMSKRNRPPQPEAAGAAASAQSVDTPS